MPLPTRPSRAETLTKRFLDLTVSVLVLGLCLPLLVLLAILVRLEDRGPFLFSQERVGMNGKAFRLLKIRSMRLNDLPVEAMGQVRSGNPMVTRIGRIIRRLKIDEVPQFINVLRGEMSLVGPRPTVRSQVAQYDETQSRRLTVRPGLTGWAQINGNTQLDWEERILLDLWYVDHWSLGLDVLIMIRTLGVVLGGETVHPSAVKEAMDHAHRSDRRS